MIECKNDEYLNISAAGLGRRSHGLLNSRNSKKYLHTTTLTPVVSS